VNNFFGLDRRGGGEEEIISIPLDRIEPNPYQPRKKFEPEKMEELAQSIKTYGLLQPVVLRKEGARYQIVAGERRYQACRMLRMKQIPAIIREVNESGMAALGLIENLQRENLSPIEEAEGYRRLIEEFQLTQEVLAQRLGKSQSTIANKIRILRLPAEIKALVNEGELTERHARSLLRLDKEEDQLQLAEKAVSSRWSVKELEDRVEKLLVLQEDNRRKKKSRHLVVRDVRIFLNTLNEAIRTIRQAGLEPAVDQEDCGDYYEVRIRLPKQPG